MHSFNISLAIDHVDAMRLYTLQNSGQCRPHIYIYIYICVCACVCVRVYYTYKYIHTQLRTHDLYIYIYTLVFMYVCMYVCMYVHAHTDTHTHSLSHIADSSKWQRVASCLYFRSRVDCCRFFRKYFLDLPACFFLVACFFS